MRGLMQCESINLSRAMAFKSEPCTSSIWKSRKAALPVLSTNKSSFHKFLFYFILFYFILFFLIEDFHEFSVSKLLI
jgi:hypothetical protein